MRKSLSPCPVEMTRPGENKKTDGVVNEEYSQLWMKAKLIRMTVKTKINAKPLKEKKNDHIAPCLNLFQVSAFPIVFLPKSKVAHH